MSSEISELPLEKLAKVVVFLSLLFIAASWYIVAHFYFKVEPSVAKVIVLILLLSDSLFVLLLLIFLPFRYKLAPKYFSEIISKSFMISSKKI